MPRPLASSNSSYQTGNEDGGTTVEENGLTRKQIQNIFYVSLLIKDGHVRLSMDDEQLHVLYEERQNLQVDNRSAAVTNQVIMPLRYEDWEKCEFLNSFTTLRMNRPFSGVEKPASSQKFHINIAREPVDRLLSHYYFLRFGDNFRIGLKQSRAGNNETFNECVLRGGHDCDMKQMWLQIPYFCGHHHFCTLWKRRSRQSISHYIVIVMHHSKQYLLYLSASHLPSRSSELLREFLNTIADSCWQQTCSNQAKKNLIDKYLIVGVSEQIRDFIALLDRLLPRFNNGVLMHLDSLSESRAHFRNTKRKYPPSDHTLSTIRRNEAYQLEREFYEFAKEEFKTISIVHMGRVCRVM